MSYIHQQRCRRQQKGVEAEVEEAQGGDQWLGRQQDLLLELLAGGVGDAAGVASGAGRSSWCCSGNWRGGRQLQRLLQWVLMGC